MEVTDLIELQDNTEIQIICPNCKCITYLHKWEFTFTDCELCMSDHDIMVCPECKESLDSTLDRESINVITKGFNNENKIEE